MVTSCSVEFLQLDKVETNDLLNRHLVLHSHLSEIERDFVSLIILDDLVEDKFLFNGELLRTRCIESKESGWVQDSVLKVPASLGFYALSSKSFSVSVGDLHRHTSARGV